MFTRITQSFFAVLLVLSFNAQADDAWSEASAVVATATEEMLTVLSSDEYAEGDEEALAAMTAEVGTILDTVVDFPYVSKLVMGKYYRRAPKESYEQFTGVFRHTLLKTYAKAVVGFKIVEYKIEPPRKPSPKPVNQIVNVTVASDNGTEYSLVYYMTKKSGSWKLVNVVMDGVNLRITFKNQFADLTQQNKGDAAAAVNAWEAHVGSAEVAK